MRVLHDHILAHGVPIAIYSDKHSIFRINAKEANPEAETQFSRAARELGIECIVLTHMAGKTRIVSEVLDTRVRDISFANVFKRK